MTVTDSPGLRERKRLATRRAIQRAVLELAVERGLDRVTVEEVSRLADISPRTFFNYFVSKEAAITGDAPTLENAAALDPFLAGGPTGDILIDLGILVSDSADNATDDRDMLVMRRALHKDNPHLFALRMAGMKHFEDELAGYVQLRLAADEPALRDDPVELASRSRLLTLVALGVLRHAWTSWADSDQEGTAPLRERLQGSFAELRGLLVRPTPA